MGISTLRQALVRIVVVVGVCATVAGCISDASPPTADSRRHADALLRGPEIPDVGEPVGSPMRRLRFHAKGRSGIRLAVHVGVLLAVGAGGEAMAKSRRHCHAHRPHRHSMHTAVLPTPVQPALHLGPMRYYGGPKSPMWRAPAEY